MNGPQWLTIEFKHSLLSLSSYTFRSVYHEKDFYAHLRNWDIYGSIDGCEWELIDRRIDCSDINEFYVTADFECNIKKDGVYRFFKIQQTGVGFSNGYGFGIRRIDLYGILHETDYVPKCKINTLKCNNIIISAHFIITFLLIN